MPPTLKDSYSPDSHRFIPVAGRLDALFFSEMLGANKTPPFRISPALDPTALQTENGKQIQRRRVVSLLEGWSSGLKMKVRYGS